MAISDCLLSGKAFCGIYTVPPYTVLLCSVGDGVLYVVDTHAVSDKLKGDCKNGVVVQCLHTSTEVAAVSNWLFARLFGTHSHVEHEFAIMMPGAADDTDDNPASQDLFSQSCTVGNGSASAAHSGFLQPLPIPATFATSLDNTCSEKVRHILWNEARGRGLPERCMTAAYHDAVERPKAVVHPCKSLPLLSTSARTATTTESSAPTDVRSSMPSHNRSRSGTTSATGAIYDEQQYSDVVEVPDEDEVVIHGSSSAESDDDDGFDWHLWLDLSPRCRRPTTGYRNNAADNRRVTDSRSSRRGTARRHEDTGALTMSCTSVVDEVNGVYVHCEIVE